MRLEDERLVRDPNPSPPRVIRPATKRVPEILGPPPPSDLIRLLADPEARVRRRAALALGRVGLRAGVEPLTRLLVDEEVEVRQMAAFALGLLGDGAARPALLKALGDGQPSLQGRAAEALGAIGQSADAEAIGAMVRDHVSAGALAGIEPDELGYPLTPAAEAVRLGLYGLARLKSYDSLAGAVLDAQGQPVSRWWPLAYAVQRVGDERAVPALLTLLDTPGRYTASFAVRGLGAAKAVQAAAALREIVSERRRHPAVVVQALRALPLVGDKDAVPVLRRVVADPSVTGVLREEAMNALLALVDATGVDLLLDFVSDPAPTVRAGALGALARVDPATFLTTLAVLDADPDWRARVAVATALGGLPSQQGLPRLTLMLDERDTRVIPSVLTALAVVGAPGALQALIERLGSDDFVTRAAAARALAQLKAPEAVPPLVAAYRAAARDTTYVARVAMLEAIAQLDPSAARPLLEEGMKDRDWAVRVRTLELLSAQGVTGLEDAIRPAVSGRSVDDPARRALAAAPFSPHAFIETDKGIVEVELAVLDAPLTVDNFISLARKGFFNGIAIHRVVPDFVVQDGDPRGDGEGGPGYTIRDEINQRPYLRGIVGMALDWEDTGGSQFFITHSPQPHLDGRYTVFGHIVSGMEVVDQLAPGDVVRDVTIWDGVNLR